MAIIARWRMPPESSKAYWSKRRGASEMPTRSRNSIEVFFASAFGTRLWSISCSTIWSPMVMAGAKLAIGSWKIIETAPPRTRRRSFGRLRVRASVCRPSRSSRIREPSP